MEGLSLSSLKLYTRTWLGGTTVEGTEPKREHRKHKEERLWEDIMLCLGPLSIYSATHRAST